MENVIKKYFSLKFQDKKQKTQELLNDELISGDVTYFNKEECQPVVLIIHGFKAFKEWGFLPFLSNNIAEKIGIAIKFNFSLNGYSQDINENSDKEISDIMEYPEKFEINTVSREIEEFLFILNELENGRLLDDEIAKLWNGKIYILGFSLGAGIAVISSSINDNIDKIAVWGGISKLVRWTTHQKQLWYKKGFLEFINSKTNQVLRISSNYLKDIENNFNDKTIINAINKIKCPLLIIHGTEDLTVPISEAKDNYENSNKEMTKFVKINGTGHTFGTSHPFEIPSQALIDAIKHTFIFFKT